MNLQCIVLWYDLTELPFEENILGGSVFFLQQDVAELGKVLEKFHTELEKLTFLSTRQAMEILVLADEVVSNGLIASFTNSPERRSEMLFGRWSCTSSEFKLIVIDLGKGLFKNIVVERIAAKTEREEIDIYQKSNVVTLMRNGKTYSHTRTGRGLAMINGLASDYRIDLITGDWVVHVEENINAETKPKIIGSRFSVKYALHDAQNLADI